MKTYVGTDGKLHFVNSAGADTVLNFSSKVNCSEVILEETAKNSRVCRVIDSTGIIDKGVGTGDYSGNKIVSSLSSNTMTYTALITGVFLICDTVDNIILKEYNSGDIIHTFKRGDSTRYTFIGFMGWQANFINCKSGGIEFSLIDFLYLSVFIGR